MLDRLQGTDWTEENQKTIWTAGSIAKKHEPLEEHDHKPQRCPNMFSHIQKAMSSELLPQGLIT